MNRLAGSRAGRWASCIWAGFAFGCGVAFAVSLSGALVLALLCAAAAGVVLCASMAPHRLAPAGLVFAAVALGLVRGESAVVIPGPGALSGHLGARPLVILGTVRSADPGSGSTAIIDARHLSDADTDQPVAGGLLVSGPLVPALSPGDRVEVDAAGLRALNRRPGANSADTLERDDVEALATSPQVFVLAAGGLSPARAIAWAQQQLLTAVDAALPEPAAALVVGIAFGIHEPISADVRAPLQDAGLIHIVVVSGFRFGWTMERVGWQACLPIGVGRLAPPSTAASRWQTIRTRSMTKRQRCAPCAPAEDSM